MPHAHPMIKKQDGTSEPFRPEKLHRSLIRAGAGKGLADTITKHLEREVRNGDTTTKIYKHAFALLKREAKHTPSAARYSMKRAVQELGPSGFPFEDFVAEIFKARGYTVRTRAVMEGKCATHEVDMVAEKDGKVIGAEMKFHNSLHITSDLKVALYVAARFDDLKGYGIDEGLLVTNTRFTLGARAYGRCKPLAMVSWNTPHHESLETMIEEAGVQPITALSTLNSNEKRSLLEKNIVLCHTLNEQPPILSDIFNEKRLEAVLKESSALCGVSKKV